MQFPYHLTNDNENRLIQPFVTQYSCTEKTARLQQLNIHKLSKQVNFEKQQAVQNVEKNLQAAINNKFPSQCTFITCFIVSMPLCFLPALSWAFKIQNQIEDIIQNWLNESNKYLEQYNISVFRNRIKMSYRNGDNDQRICDYDYIIYTFNQEEKQKVLDELYYTTTNNNNCCCFKSKLVQQRNDIVHDYQSPNFNNQNQNQQQYLYYANNNTQQNLQSSVVQGQPINKNFQMRTDQNFIQ
ncbi:hypothetical protein PPERSA_05360 [Pseudocohnilembus persalinus]|uniref:Uncharacterized protein n=1 Tax=Pseudocohnilembus persalinus TaxID=266149 RepID=A0A0V0R7Q5_PSEPJ|nr:hypothetical protein PPERSA_05360 [Pseudocohnilembus persalinus]|eukprot:KRX10540.1 hypothetical protein PPERSA_05360 [Pseudocohnilembus persalinus]